MVIAKVSPSAPLEVTSPLSMEFSHKFRKNGLSNLPAILQMYHPAKQFSKLLENLSDDHKTVHLNVLVSLN